MTNMELIEECLLRGITWEEYKLFWISYQTVKLSENLLKSSPHTKNLQQLAFEDDKILQIIDDRKGNTYVKCTDKHWKEIESDFDRMVNEGGKE